MKKTLTTILFLMIANTVFAQKAGNTKLLINNWGEINEQIPKHRGKSSLVCVKLRADNSFTAFENSCTASITQNGTWKRKGKTIAFTIIETIISTNEKGWKGRILEEKTGTITYKIDRLTDNEFIISNEKLNKKFIFKPTTITYNIQ
jgi:hypothetical protein